jgi:phosphomannomutase
MSQGTDVINLGLSTTPTVEMAVTFHKAIGGIIITASHNPGNWNALKFLTEKGEFISEEEGEQLIELAKTGTFKYVTADKLGKHIVDNDAIMRHIHDICTLPVVDTKAIADAGFTVAYDAVNSTGGIALPLLLSALGVSDVAGIYTEPDGIFKHNPEPLPEHLGDISRFVVETKSHVGFVVDPDVDRLAVICENGEMFGEEYTLVAVADYILSHKKGSTVSNLSSTQALKDVTERSGCQYFASAVGEVNVVAKMKETNAVIGGEGNGGIIYPELHYGRDALVGIALFLTHLAKSRKKCSDLRDSYPSYFIAKKKITLSPEMNVKAILKSIKTRYKSYPLNDIDGLKIIFDNDWVHLRSSNTEPIIRIYSESDSMVKAEKLAGKIMSDIGEIMLEK